MISACLLLFSKPLNHQILGTGIWIVNVNGQPYTA